MSKSIKFKEETVVALVGPATGRDEYRDSETAGLYLRVTAQGIKTFSYIGRAKGSGRVERYTIGKHPGVRVKEAQARAMKLAGLMADGTSAAQAARSKRREMTLSDLHREYLADARTKRKRPDKIDDIFRLYVADAFGTRKLSEIAHTDIALWHRGLPKTINRRREVNRKTRATALAKGESPVLSSALRMVPTAGTRSANQALKLVHAMYRWAIERARLYAGDNPAHGIEPFKETSRDRFLKRQELAPFFEALRTEPNETLRDFFLVALLTGARRSNVLMMRWAQVHLDDAEWRIPDTKNGTPQTVTLAPEAVAILSDRLARSSSEWVFHSSASKTGHVTEPKAAWKRIIERAGLKDLRVHDLRRTLGSWQAGTGASLVLIGKSLNHQSAQSTQVYARLDLDPVRQSVERATSAMFEAAGLKESAQVVPLRSGRV